MILDGKNLFTAIATGDLMTTTGAGTGDHGSTNAIDGGVYGSSSISTVANGGTYGTMWLVVRVTTAFTSASSTATYQAVLQESVDNSTYTDIMASPAYLISDGTLADNCVLWVVKLPQIKKRYIRIAHRIGVDTILAGTIHAFLTPDVSMIDLFQRDATTTVSAPTGALDHSDSATYSGVLDS